MKMRYFFIDGTYIPKHCIYGPRPREAVFFNDWEWYDINDNLYRWGREKEVAEIYAAKEQHKKEMSLNMTKNWQNTLASIKTQSEQRRIDKRNKDRQDKIDEYNRILESRKEERKTIATAAKKLLFETKDTTTKIVSALNRCEAITEQAKQTEFRKLLNEERARKEALYAQRIMQDVADFRREEQEKKRKALETVMSYRNALVEQANDRRNRIEEAQSKERKAEEKDILKMQEFQEKLKQCERREKMENIKRLKILYEKGYHTLEVEKSKAIEEEEETECNRMINKYAKRFAKERAEKEARMIEEKIKNREKMTEILCQKLKANKGREEEIYEKAVREIEEQKMKEAKEREEARMKSKMDMEAWEKEHKAKVAAGRLAEQEALKWTILQNERKREIDRAFAEALKKKEKEEKLRTREGYDMQVKEKEEAAEEHRRQDSVFLAGKNADVDEMLKYCDDALEFTKAHGWKNYPLLAAVANLKKEYGVPAEEALESSEEREGANRPKGARPKGSFGFDCYCFKN